MPLSIKPCPRRLARPAGCPESRSLATAHSEATELKPVVTIQVVLVQRFMVQRLTKHFADIDDGGSVRELARFCKPLNREPLNREPA